MVINIARWKSMFAWESEIIDCQILIAYCLSPENVEQAGKARLVENKSSSKVASLVLLPSSSQEVQGLTKQGVLVHVPRLAGHAAPAAAWFQLLEELGQVACREQVLVQDPQALLILACKSLS